MPSGHRTIIRSQIQRLLSLRLRWFDRLTNQFVTVAELAEAPKRPDEKQKKTGPDSGPVIFKTF